MTAWPSSTPAADWLAAALARIFDRDDCELLVDNLPPAEGDALIVELNAALAAYSAARSAELIKRAQSDGRSALPFRFAELASGGHAAPLGLSMLCHETGEHRRLELGDHRWLEVTGAIVAEVGHRRGAK